MLGFVFFNVPTDPINLAGIAIGYAFLFRFAGRADIRHLRYVLLALPNPTFTIPSQILGLGREVLRATKKTPEACLGQGLSRSPPSFRGTRKQLVRPNSPPFPLMHWTK